MKAPSEQDLAAYLSTWTQKTLTQRLLPWFQGKVTAVLGSTFPLQVMVRRNGEEGPDGGTYLVANPTYVPQVGDLVDCLWRDDHVGYAAVPLSSPSGAPRTGWLHWSRYVVGPGGSGDTSSNPGGDIPLPSGFSHAWVVVSDAYDTGTAATAAFAGLQVGIAGKAIDTASNYIWTDKDVFTNTGGTTSESSTGNPNGQDIAWAPFVLTGGGTGPSWPSSANIYLPGYTNPNNHATAFWDILQINNSTIVRRMGAGYYAGVAGPTTKLHCFARVNHMAAGTTFDLYVSS